MKLTVNKTLLRNLDDFINRDEQKIKKKRHVIQVWTLPDFFTGITTLQDLLSSMQFK